jgi:hypothetical protein
MHRKTQKTNPVITRIKLNGPGVFCNFSVSLHPLFPQFVSFRTFRKKTAGLD